MKYKPPKLMFIYILFHSSVPAEPLLLLSWLYKHPAIRLNQVNVQAHSQIRPTFCFKKSYMITKYVLINLIMFLTANIAI